MGDRLGACMRREWIVSGACMRREWIVSGACMRREWICILSQHGLAANESCLYCSSNAL